MDLVEYLRWRLGPPGTGIRLLQLGLASHLAALEVLPPAIVAHDRSRGFVFSWLNRRVELFEFDLPGVRIVAFQRNRQSRWKELGGPPDGSQPALERPLTFHANFASARKHVFDLRSGKYLGRGPKRGLGFAIELDPYEPRIFAVFDRMPRPGVLRATPTLSLGQTIRFEDRTRRARARVVHYVLRRPDGQAAPRGEGNLYSASGTVRGQFPTALSDPPGAWTLETTDITTGHTNKVQVEVTAPGSR
jgi:hypothetical protein